MSLFLRPTPLFLVGTGNFFVSPGMDQGNLPHKKMIPFFHGVRDQSPDFICWFKQKAQIDAPISDEPRQVANGCAVRVKSFTGYDMNGYRFHIASYEQSRPNRKTTNSGVVTPNTDGLDYYGRIEEIYELSFYGSKPLTPVIFKCHWFHPRVTRWTPKLGLVEIR